MKRLRRFSPLPRPSPNRRSPLPKRKQTGTKKKYFQLRNKSRKKSRPGRAKRERPFSKLEKEQTRLTNQNKELERRIKEMARTNRKIDSRLRNTQNHLFMEKTYDIKKQINGAFDRFEIQHADSETMKKKMTEGPFIGKNYWFI